MKFWFAALLSFFALVPNLLAQTEAAHPKGVFGGQLVLLALDDGRNMKLQQEFSYTDWENQTLSAPVGFVSDGATIPRAAWSIVGGPWDGKYRAAAVVHDVGCDTHKYTWQDTARLFYEAMIDSDVPQPQALTMYYAVYVGGPHWKEVSSATGEDAKVAITQAVNGLTSPASKANISIEKSETDRLITKSLDKTARDQDRSDPIPEAEKVAASAIAVKANRTPVGPNPTWNEVNIMVDTEHVDDTASAAAAPSVGPPEGPPVGPSPSSWRATVFAETTRQPVSEGDLKKILAEATKRQKAKSILTPDELAPRLAVVTANQ
jgi:hypothetical protein